MFNYVVKTAMSITNNNPENIRVWRKGAAIQFKVEAPAPRHIFGSITRVDNQLRIAAWVYEGVSYTPTPFLNLTAEIDELYYWLDRCIVRIYEPQEVI
jgi:hypothetical protein